MMRWSSWQSRGRRFGSRMWLRVVALVATVGCAVMTGAPVGAAPVQPGHGSRSAGLFGYAAGPRQHIGTAAGKPHHVPASATRARVTPGRFRGHRAPRPHLAPPPVGTPAHVRTGSARMPRGLLVTGHRIAGPAPGPGVPPRATVPPRAPAPPGPAPSVPASPSPSAARSPGTPSSPGPSPSASGPAAARGAPAPVPRPPRPRPATGRRIAAKPIAERPGWPTPRGAATTLPTVSRRPSTPCRWPTRPAGSR